MISALGTKFSYNLLQSDTLAEVDKKTKCHITGEDNFSGKKPGMILSDSVTDVEISQEPFLARALSLSAKNW